MISESPWLKSFCPVLVFFAEVESSRALKEATRAAMDTMLINLRKSRRPMFVCFAGKALGCCAGLLSVIPEKVFTIRWPIFTTQRQCAPILITARTRVMRVAITWRLRQAA